MVLVGCLRRLRVIRPASLFELLASIEVLRFELEHRPAVIAVDGMGSFFWQDKVMTTIAAMVIIFRTQHETLVVTYF